MRWVCQVLLLFWCCVVEGAVEIPSKLPVGRLNVLVVTDVHSWIGGHRFRDESGDSPQVLSDATYGDVLSVYLNLKAQFSSVGRDLLFVNNGDVVDGTGLSRVPPRELTRLLERMPFDALTTGNHELYQAQDIEFFNEDWWHRDGYVTSNVEMHGEPVSGRRYLVVGDVLILGFLYDMKDNDPLVDVKSVEDAVSEDWFLEALQLNVTAVVALCHMDVEDELVSTIREAIREKGGQDLPVIFVTGHTHYRGFKEMDERAVSFEAGRYLETIGFVSISEDGSFEHRFLDTSVEALNGLCENNNCNTTQGTELDVAIRETRNALGLDEMLGCLDETYRTRSDPEINVLFVDTVLPQTLFPNSDQIVVHPRTSFRSDLQGNVVLEVDDVYSFTPFQDNFYKLAVANGEQIQTLLDDLNGGGNTWRVRSTPLDSSKSYDLYTIDFDTDTVCDSLSEKLDIECNVTLVFPNHTATSVWFDFLKNQGDCSTLSPTTFESRLGLNDDDDDAKSYPRLSLLAAAALFLCVIFIAGIRFRCDRTRLYQPVSGIRGGGGGDATTISTDDDEDGEGGAKAVVAPYHQSNSIEMSQRKV